MSTTPCHLTILTALDAEQIAELTLALETLSPDDPDVAEALRENSVIRFEEILEGAIPIDLMRLLCRRKISYMWQWEQFYGTGGGLQFYDAENDFMEHFRIHEELVVMPISAAGDTRKVADTKERIERMKTLLTAVGQPTEPF